MEHPDGGGQGGGIQAGRSENERDVIPMPGAGNHFLADEADIQQGHQG